MFLKKTRLLLREFFIIITNPVFIGLTVAAASLISFSSYIILHFEQGINPGFNSVMDGIWWSVSTVTTVGYGDVTPITFWGRIWGMVVMLLGSAIFVSFTGFLAAKFFEMDLNINPELSDKDE